VTVLFLYAGVFVTANTDADVFLAVLRTGIPELRTYYRRYNTGAPCGRCNKSDDGEWPRLPDGFETEVDTDGWRH